MTIILFCEIIIGKIRREKQLMHGSAGRNEFSLTALISRFHRKNKKGNGNRTACAARAEWCRIGR